MYTSESKKRRPRFSNAEIAVLVNEVYGNKEVLFSKKCSTYSNEQKSRAWQAVTDNINHVCVVEPRTPDEVRRKWYYYLSDKKKETARHKQAQKKNASRNILYSPTDLKILEILGEIDAGETSEDGVEGLICEVDADALPLRSPSSTSSINGELGPLEEQQLLNPEVSLEEEEEGIQDDQHDDLPREAMNGFIETLKEESATTESDPHPLYEEYHQLNFRSNGHRRRQRDDDDDDKDDDSNTEFLQLEKRRIMLQECQLQVLQNIHKQMQEDSERNRAFQEAFLDIQKQRLELKKVADRHKT